MLARLNNKKGMSLPEALLGILITVFVVIGSLEMFGRGHQLLSYSYHRTTAINIAKEKLEYLKSLSDADLGDGIFVTYVDGGSTITSNWNNQWLSRDSLGITAGIWSSGGVWRFWNWETQDPEAPIYIDEDKNIVAGWDYHIWDIVSSERVIAKHIILRVRWREQPNASLTYEVIDTIFYDPR